MSRSYRKPYASVTGNRSAADDKRVARRMVRGTQNAAIRDFRGDWEEFLLPVRYECSFNDVWSWGRDGKQRLLTEPTFHDQMYWFHCGSFTDERAMEYALEHFERSKKRFERLKRK